MLLFDGENRKIKIDVSASAIKHVVYGQTWYMLDAADLYSAWKRWCSLSDGLKYPEAFAVLGGEDIGSGLRVGTYVFLKSTNGWILQPPDEDNTTIAISGNLYPDIANYPVIEPSAEYTFSLIMRNSSLTQTRVESTGSGLSSEQDTILRAAATQASLQTINAGLKNASLLIPHNTDI